MIILFQIKIGEFASLLNAHQVNGLTRLVNAFHVVDTEDFHKIKEHARQLLVQQDKFSDLEDIVNNAQHTRF